MKPLRAIVVKALPVLLFCAVLCGGGTVAAAENKAESIRSRVTAMDLVREKITDRMAEALKVKQHLGEMVAELTEEIAYDCETHGIDTYKKAVAHMGLERSLRLAQQLFSYQDAIEAQILSMQEGDQQLRYLRQEADDNLKIIATMSDLDIGTYIQEVEAVVQRTLQQVRRRLFVAKDISYQHSPDTWKRIRKEWAE
jgi:hypothetical protein